MDTAPDTGRVRITSVMKHLLWDTRAVIKGCNSLDVMDDQSGKQKVTV